MSLEQIIVELKKADKELEGDGYKSWCYTRLAIGNAIKELQERLSDSKRLLEILRTKARRTSE